MVARILADSVATEGQVRDVATNGIEGGDRCRVDRCPVYLTGGAGMDLGVTGRVLNCEVLRTTGHGMTLGDGSAASRTRVSTAGFVVRNFFNNNGTNSTGSGGTAAPEQSIATATNPVANIDF